MISENVTFNVFLELKDFLKFRVFQEFDRLKISEGSRNRSRNPVTRNKL